MPGVRKKSRTARWWISDELGATGFVIAGLRDSTSFWQFLTNQKTHKTTSLPSHAIGRSREKVPAGGFRAKSERVQGEMQQYHKGIFQFARV